MEEAARAARQQTSIERQDRTYHGGAPSPGYHGVEPTLGGSNVPHGSDSADSASQSMGRGYGMVCLLGATALATAVEVAGILLPGPDDALIAAAVGAKGGYRVIRGIVEGSKGTTREIAVVLSKEGKVLSRTELEALRKCGAPGSGRAAIPTGQIHHPISIRVGRALDSHPTLRGQFQPRDPRFTTRAIDEAAHRGYETWHRQLDAEVVQWIRDPANARATPQQFLDWIRWRYSQPDLRARFPKGF
jgi:hypothetical protein